MPLALKLIAASACPSSARAQFRFKFRRIPCALGRTQYDPLGQPQRWNWTLPGAATSLSASRSYNTEAGHNKLLGFNQTSTGATGSASTSVTHSYDAAGKLQSDGLHQYHYDSQGRLQSSQTGQGADAPTTKYAHNALGQRVFKTEPLFAAASGKDGALDDAEEDPGLLKTLHDFFTRLWNPAKSDAEHLGWAYVYDEEGSLLGEYGTGGAQSAGQSQYLYLPTSQGPIPIAAEIDGRLYAIHTDHLGTPRRLTQADGQAAWQWAYTPYGDEAPTLGAQRFTNETTNPTTGSTGIAPVRFNLRYPGQYFDAESGLHYNYFRSYDPRTGRYTQSDPIGLQGGWNRYPYVGGNPLSFVDPLGLYTEIIVWGQAPGLTSSWGHMSGNINGRNYSFGPDGWDKTYKNAEDYIGRQGSSDIDREGRGIILKLTPTQEGELAQCVSSFSNYHAGANNCANPWLQCLQKGGFVSPGNRPDVIPSDVWKIIESSPNATGQTRYPGRRPIYWSR